MQPRIYVYRITFVGQPYWYWGWHKEKKYNEYYMGSPKTNKRFWDLYEPVKEILEVFEFSEEGEKLAQTVENMLIEPDLNNPLCLNEHYGRVISCRVLSESSKRMWENPEHRAKVKKAWENPELLEYHSQVCKERWNCEEYREKISRKVSEAIREKWKNEKEYRERVSEGVKRKWEDEDYRERVSEGVKRKWEDEDYRERVCVGLSESISNKWEKDQDYRDRVVKGIKKSWEDPEYKKNHSDRTKLRWEDPEYRENLSQKSRERWEDPEYRENLSCHSRQRWEDPEFRERRSKEAKEKWKDPEFREKSSGWMWITNGEVGGNRKIKKGEDIPLGFRAGLTQNKKSKTSKHE